MISVFEKEKDQQEVSRLNISSYISFSDETHEDTTLRPEYVPKMINNRLFGHQPSWQKVEVVPSTATSLFLKIKCSKNVICIVLSLILLFIIY